MNTNRVVLLWRLFLSTIVIIVIAAVIVSAIPNNANTVTVLASVQPERSIVVDGNLTIEKIYSNTSEDVRPNVYLNGLDGEQVPYGDAIIGQYDSLKGTLNLDEPGLVYERPEAGLGSTIEGIVNFFKRLLWF